MAAPWRVFWLLVLMGHALAASAWWWLSPGGFPLSHPRFWVNRGLPAAILALVTMAVVASRRHRLDLLRSILIAFPVAWAASALTARVGFPVTFRFLFLPPLLATLLMGAAAFLTFRRGGPARVLPLVGVALAAAFAGAVVPVSQRALAPDTQPLNAPLPAAPIDTDRETSARILRDWSSRRVMVHPGDGSLTLKAGAMNLTVHPLLRFISRSPDGCWTCLAPPALRDGPNLVLKSAMTDQGQLLFRYRADYDATLQFTSVPGIGPIRLEASARLLQPIFSHLNSFCDLEVWGHTRLSLAFSPCPDMLIEVRAADYPVGRPLRVAYRDAQDGFHVVEAASGEKGPFHELARGRLPRSEPLTITLHDEDRALAKVVLEDWAAQTGTSLSPTAGWGIPVNAIEFSLEGDTPRAPAAIYITLAGTSVGRGWDSVGHHAGTYRSRIEIAILAVAGD